MKKSTLLAVITALSLLLTGCGGNNGLEVGSADVGSVGSLDSSPESSSETSPAVGSSSSVNSSDKTSSDGSVNNSSEPDSSVNSDGTSSPDVSVVPPDSSEMSMSSDTPNEPKPAESSTAPKPSSSSTTPKPSESSVPSTPSSSSAKPSESSTKPSSTSSTSSTVTEEPPVSAGGFKVSGTALYDANGNRFVMRGINHAHVWYPSELDSALDGIANTGANCVRVVLADGDQWTKTSKSDLENVISKCESKGLVAVVEVHDGTGKEEQWYLENAANYWIEMKDVLNAHTDTVILNIANEWVGQWDAEKWKKGYTSVIPKLRSAGIKNTVMVDAAGWGQYGDSIRYAGKEVLDSDPDKNTMFSIHMYGSAGGNPWQIRSNLEGAVDQGLCIVVGEFGWNHSDGDVDEEYIMRYCCENDIGYIAWSWKGNSGGVEYLDLAYDWNGGSLSDWGRQVVNGVYGLKKTSVRCTVF